MIELQLKYTDIGKEVLSEPKNAILTTNGHFAILQYREVKTVTQVQGALSTYTTTEWQDVPIE